MSTLAYALMTNVRDDAPPSEKTENEHKPGVGGFVDAMAALVPAEILVLHSIILSATTSRVPPTGDSKEVVVKVTDPSTLFWVFWALITLSVIFYLIRRGRQHCNRFDIIRALIPPSAFCLWTMLQKTTAFDAVLPNLSDNTRLAVALIGATVLGLVANLLAQKASESVPSAQSACGANEVNRPAADPMQLIPSTNR